VDGADGVFRAVTFHPDGTAGQDAVLVLTVEDDGDDEEPERLAVHIRRITGLCRIVEGEAIDETLEDLEEVR
jgi:hypothetical protein